MLPDRLGSALDETLRRVALENTPTDDIRLVPKRRSRAAATYLPSAKASRRRRNLIPCPQGCGAFLRPSKLSRHLKKAHLIESDTSPSLASIKPVRPSSLTSERKYEVCSVCNATVRVERLERHMTRVHKRLPARTASASVQETASTAPPLTAAPRPTVSIATGEAAQYESCPLCGAKLKTGKMKRHMTKAHTSSLANPLFTEAVRRADLARQQLQGNRPFRQNTSQSPRKKTLCPICKVAVKANRLTNHMATVHKRRSGHSRAMQAQSAKDPTRQATTLVAPRDKNLDATKLYAHPYRERGRFGSHPSHDGFDDESSPD